MYKFSRQEQYVLILLLLAIFSGSGVLIYRNSTGQIITVMEPADNVKAEEKVPSEETAKLYVHVSGEVINPGVYELKEGSRVYEAIKMAGGVTENADMNYLNLAQILHDAQKIYVPMKGSVGLEGDEGIKENNKRGVNINSASIIELSSLPGIGQVLAQRIIEYRRTHGRFEDKKDLMKVPGIGEKRFAEIEDLIVIY